MRLFLQDGPARLQILSRSHVREFRDIGAAREFLRPLLASPGNMNAVRGAIGPSRHISDGELVEELARRMAFEGLQVISCADSYLAAVQGTFTEAAASAAAATSQSQTQTTTPLEDEQAAQAEKEQAAATEETHFIEIELLDEEGKPVPDESYVVELPDGTQQTGRTDAQGKARIEGIDPGTAKISFPDRDEKSYEK